ncbi:MAG TPA: hypothetical protein VHE81_09165 [Lacipirellulaceae bacterium]|nr:hypothetical protein [Lacipirellulaceae bacterium]
MSDASSPKPEDQGTSAPPHGEKLLHEDVRFQESHVSTIGIIGVLIAIFLVFVGVFCVSGWMLKGMETAADRSATVSHYREPAEPKPSQPRLEPLNFETGKPTNVFQSQLDRQRVLHSYGTTEEKGYVHIPIEQAMKLVLKSLPIRKGVAGPPERSFGLVGGGESNSGRLYSEAPSWLKQKH